MQRLNISNGSHRGVFNADTFGDIDLSVGSDDYPVKDINITTEVKANDVYLRDITVRDGFRFGQYYITVDSMDTLIWISCSSLSLIPEDDPEAMYTSYQDELFRLSFICKHDSNDIEIHKPSPINLTANKDMTLRIHDNLNVKEVAGSFNAYKIDKIDVNISNYQFNPSDAKYILETNVTILNKSIISKTSNIDCYYDQGIKVFAKYEFSTVTIVSNGTVVNRYSVNPKIVYRTMVKNVLNEPYFTGVAINQQVIYYYDVFIENSETTYTYDLIDQLDDMYMISLV